jgi:ELWxxDGT repeat protein
MKHRLARAVLVLLVLGAGAPARSQTPYLVKDVSPAVRPATVGAARELTVAGPSLFAFADTPAGRGVFRIDASGTPTLVREAPVPALGTSAVMTAAGNDVYFTADGGLWRSDGTAAGTTMIRQFLPSASAGGQIANVGGVIYFRVQADVSGELWKSDGTSAGTVRVASVYAGDLTPAGNRLFFTDVLTGGLWTSDGTEAGTVRLGTVVVKDVLSKMVPQGNGLLFIGAEAGAVGDLWRSDGTQAGTVKVKTFSPSLPHSLTPLGGDFLLAGGVTAPALWRTDGTEAGTTLVKDALTIRSMHEANGTVFLHGHTPATGNELWTTDGTTAGTSVLDVCPGTCSFLTATNTSYATLPTGIAFHRRTMPGEVWKTDGTVTGTIEIGDAVGCSKFQQISPMTSFAGSAYFSACNDGSEEEYRTDGATLVKLTAGLDGASSSPAFVGDASGRAIFAASRPDVGREVWSTGGSEGSTQLLVDLTPGPTGTEWNAVASLGDLFTFTTTAFMAGGALWSTDGTPAGTSAIAPVETDITRRAAVRDRIAVFAAGKGFGPPYRTDGTPEGTFPVAPPEVGVASNSGVALGQEAIATHGPGFTFLVGEITQVWSTIDGTEPAPSIAPPTRCSWLTSVDESLFLACFGVLGENELWISDGTQSGTRLLAPLPGSAVPGWVAMEGKLFFRVADPTGTGTTLWSSDGTAAGTAPLSSIATVPTNPIGLTVSNGVLYFAGFTPQAGVELWRTDGTAAGTFPLGDLDPGPASGISPDFESSSAIAAMAGGVLFTAATGTRGAELWWSDGTPAGTVPLPQIAPGPASSSPAHLRRVGARVFFSADDGTRGREPWAVELATPSVAVGDLTVAEGDAGTTTASFPVHLDLPAGTLVTLSYATVADSAQAGVDFVPVSGTLTFVPGARDLSIDVAVIGDILDESDESFALQITSVAGAALADGRGAAVIADDDLPSAAFGGASVVEGDTGTVNASFPVTLTTADGQPTTHAVSVLGEVVYGTAGRQDFPTFAPPPPPAVTFPAGTPSGTTLPMLVVVAGDTLDEPNENFQVRLAGQNDATIAGEIPTGIIVDDDGIEAAPPVELTHGSTLTADLVPPAGRASDVDFYLVQQHADASYEVVVDGISGDALPLWVSRVHPIGSALQWAQPVGTGNGVAMSWVGIGTLATEHLRVESAGCGSACGSDDTYRLRFYETTLAAPRINNHGGQVTAVILQNTTASPTAAVLTGWRADGSFGFRSAVVTIPPRGTAVLDTTQEFAGFVGSLTVAHTAPYGALVGKVVALDPATGLGFDTPLRVKPR